MSLPCKIMEQYRLCPAKLLRNTVFAPQEHGAFVLCPAKSRRLCYLSSKIMAQCRLCSAKSLRYSFRGQKISSNLNFFSFFLIIFVNHCHFQDLYICLNHFLRRNLFYVTVPLSEYIQQWMFPFCHRNMKKKKNSGSLHQSTLSIHETKCLHNLNIILRFNFNTPIWNFTDIYLEEKNMCQNKCSWCIISQHPAFLASHFEV